MAASDQQSTSRPPRRALPRGASVAVVGGGISGLAFARALRRARPDVTVTVYEREPRVGGTATTDLVDGFVVDRGPAGFLTTLPDTRDLAAAVGLGDAVVAAAPAAKRRFLWRGGRLRAIPAGLLAPSMLGVGGALRAACEPWVCTPPPADDESVAAFLARRFGARASALLAHPVVSGVTAGDATQTSLRALWPRIHEGEVAHGSVVRAMRASRRAARAEGRPAGALMTIAGGMGRLCDAVAAESGATVRCGAGVASLRRDGGGWAVELGDSVARHDHVVVATPAHVAGRLVAQHAPALAASLAAIPYTSIRVVTVGVSLEQVARPLDGFGFLVPRGEDTQVLGCVWASSTFPDRAPAGHALLRVMVGGALHPEAIDASDDTVASWVERDLRASIGLSGPPALVHHSAWRAGIPQYNLGHLDRVATVRREAADAGVDLLGNAYDGVSFNESIASAQALAKALAGAPG